MAYLMLPDDLSHLESMDFVLQARAVINVTSSKSGKNLREYQGLQSLVQGAWRDLDEAQKEPGREAYNKAHQSLQGAASLVSSFNSMEIDDPLLYAVETLLHLAHNKFDDDYPAFEEEQEAA